MTLPITDSMLRGELRPHILAEIKDNQEISQLWGILHKWEISGDQSLRGIEKALTDAVETSRLVKVSEVYNNDREMRQGVEMAREKGMLPDNPDFTRVGKPLCLDGVFTPFQPLTPTDRFRHLLLKLECRRTMKCLKELVMTMHDDGFIRTEISQLFTTIKQLCEDTDENFIRQRLTQFYFEVYHTFQSVLEKGEKQNYETDFQNFVYGWSDRFPNDETVERYEKQVAAYKPVLAPRPQQETAPSTSGQQSSEQQTLTVKPVAKDKFQKFLEAAEELHFSLLPKVQDLGTPEKIMKLVRCILQDMGTVTDTYAHAAAMLEFLEFRKWYSENYGNWSTTKYDTWCSIHVMNKQKGQAFRHYRQSVETNPDNTKQNNYKYKGWQYKNSVKQEYHDILQGVT